MNSSIIVFPGSNCDRDIAVALEKLKFSNKMVWHKETELPIRFDSCAWWFFVW